MTLEDNLLTESRNPRSEYIDTLESSGNRPTDERRGCERREAIGQAEAEPIARAIEWAARSISRRRPADLCRRGDVGTARCAGCSECPPTFSTPPETVVWLIAGGPSAITRAVEGAEDDPDRGAADMAALEIGKHDLVIGIATSGRTPYVLGAVREARRRGATTIGLACNRPSLLGRAVDLEIAPLWGRRSSRDQPG